MRKRAGSKRSRMQKGKSRGIGGTRLFRKKNIRDRQKPVGKHMLPDSQGLSGLQPLRSAAEWICDRLYPDERTVRLGRELTELGSGRKNCVREYYVQKISRMLTAVIICGLVLTAVLVTENKKNRSVADGILERPGYGAGGTDRSLNLTISGENESEAVDVHLNARLYTKAEARKLLKHAEKELTDNLPGENPSVDEVRGSLCLPAQLQNGAVSAEYYITPSGMIEDNGVITGQPEETGSLITITATLTCQDQQRTVESCVRVLPPDLTAREALQKKIRDAVEAAQTENPSDSKMQLPQQVDGRTLHWSYPQEGTIRMLLVILLILPVALWVHEDSRVRENAKARKEQLELDYSQLLWKMTMLLSAGLTIRGAFTRIAAQYQAQAGTSGKTGVSRLLRKSNRAAGQKHYVYEEMILTIREMQSGVPEASAYENFGRRCGLPSYIKLGSLLSQNLKKGSKGLISLLEHEAVLSLEQHKMAVRKMGEKAGIRMLLPMIMMFGVVLVILMVPAFLSM